MDINAFLNASLSPRTETVPVPELKEWFGKDKPEWTIRGLTAAELGVANMASDKGQENLKAMVEAMAGKGDKAAAMRKSLGILEGEVPGDVSRRIEMLAAGSVAPVLGSDNRDVAVKLAEAFPTVFYNLTNKILGLTGQGSEVGKPKPSGKAGKSAPA
jgi:hypothetical protein